MRLGIIISGLSVAAFTVVGDEAFHLRSGKTGNLYGPFKCSDGEEVVLGKSVFTVVKKQSDGNSGERPGDPVIKKAGREAADAWLELVDEGKYDEAWAQVSDYMKRTISKEHFFKSLEEKTTALGEIVSRKLKSARYVESMPSAPDGKYVIVLYETQLARKRSATETVIPMLAEDGKWKISGYDIR